MKRRQKDLASKEHKKQITYKERSKRLSAINFYITNIPLEYLPKEQVYDFYSLRWQVEIIFKTWKFRTTRVSLIRTINKYPSLFLHHVSNAPITPHQEETRIKRI